MLLQLVMVQMQILRGSVAIGQNAYSSGNFTKTASVAVGRNSIAKGNTAVAMVIVRQ